MPDRRVQRSRERLHGALIALVLEKGWDRVSVRDVCARAGVGRSTFYVHFADKEDLLVGGLEHVRDALLASGAGDAFGFVRGLVEHADESRRWVRAVIGKRSGLAVQRRFRETVGELVRADLRAQRVPARELDTATRFLAGALVEMLFAWVENRDGAIGAGDVERRFVQLAAPVVAAIAR
jgi:AcrR family transcriptional regulator